MAAHFANAAPAARTASTSPEDFEPAISRDFPPDLPFGLGTSAPRILAALAAHGLAATWIHSGGFGYATSRARSQLTAHLAVGQPAIVCVDAGRIGGPAFGAHWTIARELSGDALLLEQVPRNGPVSWRDFMASWCCRHLPLGYNHCALLVQSTQERASGAPLDPNT